MSKLVKELQVRQLRRTFDGVNDVLVVNVVGLDAIGTTALRADLRKKGIYVEVVKNNLAKLIFKEKGLSQIDSILEGASAITWGGADIVELAKEITERAEKNKKLEVKGGVISGEKLDKEGVTRLSKMPTRPELLGRVAQLIQSPGARLGALLKGPGGRVASQVKSLAEKLEKEGGGAAGAPAEGAPVSA